MLVADAKISLFIQTNAINWIIENIPNSLLDHAECVCLYLAGFTQHMWIFVEIKMRPSIEMCG